MIRVLHICNKLNRSGIESYIMNTYRNIDRNKIQFDFLLTGEKAEYDDEVNALGGIIYREIQLGNRLKLIPIYKKKLKELAKSYKIIHIHAMSCKVFFIARYAAKYGIKNIIVHCHGCGDSGLLHIVMQKLLNKYCNIKIACSDVAALAMFGKKNIADVHLIKNSIDIDLYKFDINLRISMRKELGLTNETSFISVGRFSYEKNHVFMINIFKEILKIDKTAKLFLVGWGDMENQIKSIIVQEKLQHNIIMLGKRNDINHLLNAMDVFVLPSLFEGMPVVAVEAQTNGLPVFLSDTITRQVAFTNLLTYLPLSLSAEEWAKAILAKQFTREDKSMIAKANEFDIERQAFIMQKFYEKIFFIGENNGK